MTVKEAINQAVWDSCRGTMGYSANIATDNDDNYSIYGLHVGFDGERAFIMVDAGFPEL